MSASTPAAVSRAALDSMAKHIDQLPLLPQVLVRIMQVSPAEDDYFEQITRLAREDPPFAVRLLAMANSAVSSPVSPIRSIRDALTRVGAATITNLVASLAVQRVFMPSSPSQVALWRHSIRVAVGAEALAQMAPQLGVDKHQLYLVGLLHDIGRFVMFEHAPEQLLKVDESHWRSPQELIESDVEIFKFTHCELGFLACRHWGLPDDIAQTVLRHHERIDRQVAPRSLAASILCVEVADQLDVMILEKSDCDDLSPDELAERIERHCLAGGAARHCFHPNELAGRLDAIRSESAQLFEGLGLA